MKKLVLFAVAVVAISFASCGGNKQVDAEKEAQRIKDSIEAVAAEAAAQAAATVDSLAAAVDSVAAPVAE
ncbi:MAG: hypothetical protein E6767_01235 [Dysgonomonas sp.]|nr:hypothetical protein [Dysgonomonas sp.]